MHDLFLIDLCIKNILAQCLFSQLGNPYLSSPLTTSYIVNLLFYLDFISSFIRLRNTTITQSKQFEILLTKHFNDIFMKAYTQDSRDIRWLMQKLNENLLFYTVTQRFFVPSLIKNRFLFLLGFTLKCTAQRKRFIYSFFFHQGEPTCKYQK